MLRIVISGRRAVGKSELIERLIATYGGVVDLKKISAGSFVRRLAENKRMTLAEADRHMLSNIGLHQELDEDVLRQCLASSNFVVDWRMGPMFRRQLSDALFIRLECREYERVVRYMRRQGLRYYGEAEKAMQNEELPHAEAMKKLYGSAGVFVDSDFDLIVDTTKLAPEDVFSMVRDLIVEHMPALARV